ncbi:flagellar basal-body rod modification protein FlgD [Pseudoxanthomonas sp. 3HH-4]|uniref:flagellar hook capping FlgD N-terminal domain-containing protein n=1 Tax=Pseudoxanthomonas sp. 3HH-4 TaxID=1690214 RepID=UPI001152BEBA|nr:flagellar hook capping FlgD N-terminal domain-containing protein [Pseudoxanthomonas sp. 3HH-4]TQM12426.1 flagellar basal-body rod modification protein FlgD [Pseudoxanthomonas sp. 3HH-4]
MTTINGDPFAAINNATSGAATTKKADTLGQADFMRLMTEQLSHQDPLKPLSNSEFVAQLAQFSTVQGISELNTTVGGFTSALTGDQVLKGASLVGHSVVVPSESIALPASGSATGLVMSPGAGKVTFEIKDASGVVVDTVEVEATGKGETAFAWDGLKTNGERAAAGAYSIKATHTATDGTGTALNTYVDATVDSVTIGSDGLYLNLPGLGTAPLDYVLRIGKSAS